MRLTRILCAARRRLPENHHNMPERFIRRQTAFESIVPPKMPQYNQEEVKRWREKEDTYYDIYRPWEQEVSVDLYQFVSNFVICINFCHLYQFLSFVSNFVVCINSRE